MIWMNVLDVNEACTWSLGFLWYPSVPIPVVWDACDVTGCLTHMLCRVIGDVPSGRRLVQYVLDIHQGAFSSGSQWSWGTEEVEPCRSALSTFANSLGATVGLGDLIIVSSSTHNTKRGLSPRHCNKRSKSSIIQNSYSTFSCLFFETREHYLSI